MGYITEETKKRHQSKTSSKYPERSFRTTENINATDQSKGCENIQKTYGGAEASHEFSSGKLLKMYEPHSISEDFSLIKISKMTECARVASPVPYDTAWIGDQDGCLLLREVDSGSYIGCIKAPDVLPRNRVFPTCLVADSRCKVWIGNSSGLIDVYDGYTVNWERQFMGHQGQVRCMVSVEQCDAVISGGNDFSVTCWDIHEYISLWKILGHDNNVTKISVAYPIGLSGTDSGQVRIWNIKNRLTKSKCASLRPHRRSVIGLEFWKSFAVSASVDGTIKIISIENKAVVRSFSIHVSAFHVLNEKLCIASTDGHLHFLENLESVKQLELGIHKGVRIFNHHRTVIKDIVPMKHQTFMLFHVLSGKNEVQTYIHAPGDPVSSRKCLMISRLRETMREFHVYRSKLWNLNASMNVAKTRLKKNMCRFGELTQKVAENLCKCMRSKDLLLWYQKLEKLAREKKSTDGILTRTYETMQKNRYAQIVFTKLVQNHDLEIIQRGYSKYATILQKVNQKTFCRVIYSHLKSNYLNWKRCEIFENAAALCSVSIRRFQARSIWGALKNKAFEKKKHYSTQEFLSFSMCFSMKKFLIVQFYGKIKHFLLLSKKNNIKLLSIKSKNKLFDALSSDCCTIQQSFNFLRKITQKELMRRYFDLFHSGRSNCMREKFLIERRKTVSLINELEDIQQSLGFSDQQNNHQEIREAQENVSQATKETQSLIKLRETLELEQGHLRSRLEAMNPLRKQLINDTDNKDYVKIMMENLNILKAKSVQCARDFSEIKQIHRLPSYELPNIIHAGVKDCSMGIHRLYCMELHDTSDGRWQIDLNQAVSPSSYLKKNILKSIRKIIIARDCIAARNEVTNILRKSLPDAVAREICVNFDYLTTCVDRF